MPDANVNYAGSTNNSKSVAGFGNLEDICSYMNDPAQTRLLRTVFPAGLLDKHLIGVSLVRVCALCCTRPEYHN